MRVLHETIAVQTAATLSCRDFNLPVFDCPYHRHPEFEILRINESRGRVLAGDFAGIFEPGKIYVFGSRLPHAFVNLEGTGRARSRCLQFDPARLSTAWGTLPEMRSLASLFRRTGRGLLLSEASAHRVSMILDDLFRADGLMQIAELLRLLHEIQRDGAARELASAGYSLQSPDRHLERLEAVLTHIHTHSAGALTIGGLARLAGMSDTVFHRHFRDRMGRTPVAYIQDVRLSNVSHRLLESEASVAEIAFEAGFNNLSNFNQQFRRAFGCTPRGYRRQIGSR